MKKILSLEVLRATAVLLVILFHIQTVFGVQNGHVPFGRMFWAGYRGVDLFFVLSGFIIGAVHFGDIGLPGRFKRYAFNRLTRIYPALWIMTMLAVALYAAGFGGADKADKLALPAVLASAMLLPQTGTPLVNVSWTLTYEMIFYAWFAVLILNLRLGIGLLILWQAAIVILALTGTRLGLAGYYFKPICLDFAAGLACACLTRGRWIERLISPGLLRAGLVAGLLAFVAGMAMDDTPLLAAPTCTLGACLIIVSLVRLEQLGHVWAPRLLVMIGSASYSIYLVHFATLQLASGVLRRMGVQMTDPVCLLLALLGLAAGLTFHRLIDEPLQTKLRTIRPRMSRPLSIGSSEGRLVSLSS